MCRSIDDGEGVIVGAATVAVVDNHDTIRRGVASVLAEWPDEFTFVGGFPTPVPLTSGEVATPDIVVLDLWLERDDADSLWAIEPLRARGASVVLHTAEERAIKLRAAVAAGALGLALKNDGDDAFLDTLRRVSDGEFACTSELAAALLEDGGRAARLAPREIAVLDSLRDGLTRDQVGARLGVTTGTVSTHLGRVRQKYMDLGRPVTNVTSLVVEAHRDGYGARNHI